MGQRVPIPLCWAWQNINILCIRMINICKQFGSTTTLWIVIEIFEVWRRNNGCVQFSINLRRASQLSADTDFALQHHSSIVIRHTRKHFGLTWPSHTHTLIKRKHIKVRIHILHVAANYIQSPCPRRPGEGSWGTSSACRSESDNRHTFDWGFPPPLCETKLEIWVQYLY